MNEPTTTTHLGTKGCNPKCTLHEAAGDLLEACKDALFHVNPHAANGNVKRALEAAIARAEGRAL